MADSLSLSFLHLLEKLSPVERAVFLIREVFDYPYDDVARIVGKSTANARQILARAHARTDEGKNYGQPGVVFYRPDGSLAWLSELEVADGVLVAIRTVSNPDKLAHLATG